MIVDIKQMKNEILFKLFLTVIWGHTLQCSALAFDSVLRGRFSGHEGTIQGARDQTWIGVSMFFLFLIT